MNGAQQSFLDGFRRGLVVVVIAIQFYEPFRPTRKAVVEECGGVLVEPLGIGSFEVIGVLRMTDYQISGLPCQFTLGNTSEQTSHPISLLSGLADVQYQAFRSRGAGSQRLLHFLSSNLVGYVNYWLLNVP